MLLNRNHTKNVSRSMQIDFKFIEKTIQQNVFKNETIQIEYKVYSFLGNQYNKGSSHLYQWEYYP